MQVRHLDALRTVHLWDLDALAPVWQDASTHPLGYMFVRRMLAVRLCDFQHLDAHYHGNRIYILSYPGWLVYAIVSCSCHGNGVYVYRYLIYNRAKPE